MRGILLSIVFEMLERREFRHDLEMVSAVLGYLRTSAVAGAGVGDVRLACLRPNTVARKICERLFDATVSHCGV